MLFTRMTAILVVIIIVIIMMVCIGIVIGVIVVVVAMRWGMGFLMILSDMGPVLAVVLTMC